MSAYTLHYAPDNASLIIRLVLEELGVPYGLSLVDRRAGAQHSPEYKSVNPVGRIPALETDQGALFETAAIGLWLSDRHRSANPLSPDVDAPNRGSFLSWLFYLSNTVHAELRNLFYPQTIVGVDRTAQAAVSIQSQSNLTQHLHILNTECAAQCHIGGPDVTFCDLYLAVMLRWPALYPIDSDKRWFDLAQWPALQGLARRVEARESAHLVARAEGLGPTPFSNPSLPNPPEGSAI